MLSRCRNENDCNYINYGARGIFVCERWYKFENFYSDMGDLPFYEAHIDRINNDYGYYKENCRWVSASENSKNRRTTRTTIFNNPFAAKMPAVISSESPGKKKPTNSPVSA